MPQDDKLAVLYRSALGKLLDKVTSWIGDEQKIKKIASGSFSESIKTLPLSVQSYEKLLLLALLYPFLFVALFWVGGATGTMGGIELLPVIESPWQRVLMILGLVAMFAGTKIGFDDNKSRAVRAFAVAGAFAFAVAGAGAFAFAVAVAGALAKVYPMLAARRLLALFWLVLSLIYLGFAFSLPGLVAQVADKPAEMTLVIFLVVLPLANVPIDWFSLAVTRKLLHQIQAQSHTGLRAFIWSLLDVVLALILLLLTGGVTVALLSFGNAVSGGQFFDVQAVLDAIRANPTDINNYWVYFMVFSTLVPTAIHFLVAAFALGTYVPPSVLPHLKSQASTLLYLSLGQPLGFLIPPVALAWLLLWGIPEHGGVIGGWLLGCLQSIVESTGYLFTGLL